MKYVFLLAIFMATNSYAESKSELIKVLTQRAKTEVSTALKDPDSAKFRNLKFVDSMGLGEEGVDIGVAICGEINGKNSYGGYSGFVPFLYHGKGLSMIYNEDDEIDAEYFRNTYEDKCKDGKITKIE